MVLVIFYHSSNHIRICGSKEAVFNNAEQLSEPFFDQEELIPKNFGPCLQGQAPDQAQLQICIRVLKGYSTHRDAVDDTQEILNQLGTHCNTGENEQFFFPRVRRNYPTRAVAYYANSIAARRIILSGDVVVNPGPTEGTESQGALQNKQNRARPKSNWLIRLNCRSLLQNIDEMGLIFTCNRPFMIAVTETWLNNTISNDEIHIQG